MTGQKERWDIIFGSHHREKRRRIKERFIARFPNGHKESLRPMLEKILPMSEEELLRNEFFQNLVNPTIHPRAIELLIKYGIDYIPRFFRKPPDYYNLGEPEPSRCFRNASLLLVEHNRRATEDQLASQRKENSPAVYVEGLAAGALTLPMLHAWNSFGFVGKYRAFDWTLYATSLWIRYLGIPFTQDEYCQAADLINPEKRPCALLLDSKHFPKCESYIRDLLEKRREDSQKLKAA